MNGEQGKPPTRLSEIIGEGDEEVDGPGSLEYTGGGQKMVMLGKERSGGSKLSSRQSNIAQMLIAALVAIVLSIIIIMQIAPTKGAVSGLDDRLTVAETSVTVNADAITTLTSSLVNYASKSSVASVVTDVETVRGTLVGLPAIYAKITDIPEEVDLSGLEAEVDIAIADMQAEVATALDAIPDTHTLEYSLYGTGEEYVLTVVSDKAGSFVARVTLTYDSPVALLGVDLNDAMQDFYVNCLDDPNRDYMCSLIYEGIEWKVKEVYFVTGGFTLEAGVEKSFDLRILGLLTPFDDFEKAYAEILPGHLSGAGAETPSI